MSLAASLGQARSGIPHRARPRLAAKQNWRLTLMKNFTYYKPSSVEAAVALLEQRYGNTDLLAGGTDLLALQKNYVAQPARVVSLTGIKGIAAIEQINQGGGNAIRIGAGATLAAIAAHA